jgi:hypothetical protein
MSKRSDTLSRFASRLVDTQFTQSLVESGRLLQTGKYSLLFRSQGRSSVFNYRSPVRGFFFTRQLIRQAIARHTPIMLRYRKRSLDTLGKQEVKNYRVVPVEMKLVRVREGRKALGVYATKVEGGEIRLFLLKDIILCRSLGEQPSKSARDRVLERP